MIIQNPYGVQPGREVLRQQARTVSGVAQCIGVDRQHLRQALWGRIRPSEKVRNELPAFLGVPLNELFTECALAPPGKPVYVRRAS